MDPLLYALYENTCMCQHKLFTRYRYGAAGLLTRMLEYAQWIATCVSARIPLL